MVFMVMVHGNDDGNDGDGNGGDDNTGGDNAGDGKCW